MNRQDELEKAFLQCDAAKVASLLDSDRELLSLRGKEGTTLLQRAVMLGESALAEVLLNHGAELDAADERGRTALHCAVFADHCSLAEILISQGASLAAVDKLGYTPLCLSARDGLVEMSELLIRNGADINFHHNDKGITPLHRAVYEDHLDMVKLLVRKGADINRKDSQDLRPLRVALRMKKKEIAEYLIKRGAKK
ncbi:MAG: ankyrin repeat domain-containing protein [Candidatus Xenobiia bacterium LiM19]